MHIEIRTGFGETQSAALAAAISRVLGAPGDDDSKPMIIIDGIEHTPEGYRVSVRILFLTVGEERRVEHALEKEALAEKEHHRKDVEADQKRKALAVMHQKIEEEWNEAHRIAMRADLIENDYLFTAPEVMMALHTHNEFEGASQKMTYDHTRMKKMEFDALEYAVWAPPIDLMPDLLTADNDNFIRHRYEEERRLQSLKRIYGMHVPLYSLDLAI